MNKYKIDWNKYADIRWPYDLGHRHAGRPPPSAAEIKRQFEALLQASQQIRNSDAS